MKRILANKDFLCEVTQSNKTFKGRVAIANNEEIFTLIEVLLNAHAYKHRNKEKIKQLLKSVRRGITISALKVLFFKNTLVVRSLVYSFVQSLVKEAVFSMCDSD